MATQLHLAFDIGIDKFAYCIIEGSISNRQPARQSEAGEICHIRIVDWAVFTLGSKSTPAAQLVSNLVQALQQRSVMSSSFSTITIEQQASGAVKMRILSHAIQTFFLARGLAPAPVIQFASGKLKPLVASAALGVPVDLASVGCKTYRERKATAIRHSQDLLKRTGTLFDGHVKWADEGRLELDIWTDTFMNAKKKDDLADALLFALHGLSLSLP